jgi:osmoprotectant transport system permease protein
VQADLRLNPVLGVLALLATLALCGLPFVSSAPNRLVAGEGLYLTALWPTLIWPVALVAAGLALLLTSAWLKPRWSAGVCGGLAGLLMPALLWLAGMQAQTAAQPDASALATTPLITTSLGSGFWLTTLLLGLMVAESLQRWRAKAAWRAAVWLLVLALFAGLLASGACDALSLLKEAANRSGGLASAVARHAQIVGLALAFTLCLGLPLGWLAANRPAVGRALLPVLNMLQTIPSIALFGLLMAPLAWLASAVPGLGRAGVSGVGLAPAVLALTLYSLLPVVRATWVGLAQLPPGVLQAARGLGMSARQQLLRVETPLALPVVLGGVRTAAVQAVGLAAVTALIGAGGLGAVIFEGLFSAAQDVVLLGVLPLVALGAVTGSALQGLIGWAQRSAHGHAGVVHD